MIHWVQSTFKWIEGHLNGIFLTSNFERGFSRYFVNRGKKDWAKFLNFDPCTVCGKTLRVSGGVYLPAFWATRPYYSITCKHWFFIIVIRDLTQKAGNTVIRGCGPKSRQIDPSWNPQCFAAHCAGVKIWEFCLVLLATVYKMSGQPPRKIASQKDAI